MFLVHRPSLSVNYLLPCHNSSDSYRLRTTSTISRVRGAECGHGSAGPAASSSLWRPPSGGQLEPARPPKAGRGEAPLAVGARWQHSVPDGCWTEGLTSRAAGGQGPSSAPAARTTATQRPAHDQTPEERITGRRGRRETSRAGRRLQVSSPPTPCPPRPVSDH